MDLTQANQTMTLNRFLLLLQLQGANIERPEDISVPRWRAMIRSASKLHLDNVMAAR